MGLFLILQIIQETLVLIHLIINNNISIIIIKVVTTTTKITTTLPLPQLQQPIDQVPQIEVRMGKLTTESFGNNPNLIIRNYVMTCPVHEMNSLLPRKSLILLYSLPNTQV